MALDSPDQCASIVQVRPGVSAGIGQQTLRSSDCFPSTRGHARGQARPAAASPTSQLSGVQHPAHPVSAVSSGSLRDP